MGKEYIVELMPGHRYRYRYDDGGKIVFLGPVGDSQPITEESFLQLLWKSDALEKEGRPGKSTYGLIKPPEPEPAPEPPCDCGVDYLKQGIIWWCESCKNNFVME